MLVKARRGGEPITSVDAERIIIDNADEYELQKFAKLNERTCQTQKPIVKLGDTVESGQIIADGASTQHGQLAIGKNALVAFNTFDGYNFEDAIVISERLVKDDVFTSIHIESFDVEVRDTKLGREEFTRRHPQRLREAAQEPRRRGIIRHRCPRRPRRHPRRQGQPQEQVGTDARGETAPRDLRPCRRGREERLPRGACRQQRHRHRHAALQPPHAPHRRAEGKLKDDMSSSLTKEEMNEKA